MVEVLDANGELVTILEPTVDVLQVVTTDLVGPPVRQCPAGADRPDRAKRPTGPFAPTVRADLSRSPQWSWVIRHNLGRIPW